MMLNTANHAHPVALLYLWRLLTTMGGPVAEQRLINLLSPASLSGAAPQRRGTQAVNDAKSLSIVTGKSSGIELSKEFRDLQGEEAFHQALSRKVFATEFASHFRQALGWYLRLPAWEAPSDVDSILLRARGQCEVLSGNQNVVRGFIEWTCFLGFGWAAPWGFVADASVKLSRDLSAIFGLYQQLEAKSFLAKVYEMYPLDSDGSVWFSSIPSKDYKAIEVPSSLSRALVVLQRMERISFDRAADAADAMLLLGPGGRVADTISAVRVLGGGPS